MNRTEAQAARLSMIAALREHLGGVGLEIGVLPRIGRADQGKLIQCRVGADPGKLLSWCALQQIREHAQILIRPDVDAPHPWLLVDDVPTADAVAFAARRAALVIETSAGNTQLRILADRAMSMPERTQAQRVLRAHLHGDPGSIAGDKFGRLAGYTNQKQGKEGHWTRLLRSDLVCRRVSASALLAQGQALAQAVEAAVPALAPALAVPFFPQGGRSGKGSSCLRSSSSPATEPGGSRQDYGWVCDEIRAGTDPRVIEDALADAAQKRGKSKSKPEACRKYAARTVAKALIEVASNQ